PELACLERGNEAELVIADGAEHRARPERALRARHIIGEWNSRHEEALCPATCPMSKLKDRTGGRSVRDRSSCGSSREPCVASRGSKDGLPPAQLPNDALHQWLRPEGRDHLPACRSGPARPRCEGRRGGRLGMAPQG